MHDGHAEHGDAAVPTRRRSRFLVPVLLAASVVAASWIEPENSSVGSNSTAIAPRTVAAVPPLSPLERAHVAAQVSPPLWQGPEAFQAYSAQLHVHGSHSEGGGSMSSHTRNAVDAGVDVLWWSDHDWRIDQFHHVTRYGFEDWTEPMSRSESWTPSTRQELLGTKGLLEHRTGVFDELLVEFDTQNFTEGTASFSLRMRNDSSSWQTQSYWLSSSRQATLVSLTAGLEVQISVHPTSAGSNNPITIECDLSYHPDNAYLGAGWYEVEYVLDNSGSSPFLDGKDWVVPLAYTPDTWNHYTLPLTQDALVGFPFIDGEDCALVRVIVGGQSRNGAVAAASFDDLRVIRTKDGQHSYTRQEEMLLDLEGAEPSVVQHQGLEFSYAGLHINEFSLDTGLYDLEQMIEDSGLADPGGYVDNSGDLARYMSHRVAREVRERGGLVSFNHPYGTPNGGDAPDPSIRAETLEKLLELHVLDCDLFEVGYRFRVAPIDWILWLWDRLILRGYFLTGTGTSDDHIGYEDAYLNRENNFVTWIWTTDTRKTGLLDGLRRGAVWFGDPSRFDGELGLVCERGYGMGHIVVSDRHREQVTVVLNGLQGGEEIRVMQSGTELTRVNATGSSFVQTFPITLRDDIEFVRIEAYSPTGVEVAFSNPVIFVRPQARRLKHGMDPYRTRIDVMDLWTTAMRAVVVQGVEVVPGSSGPVAGASRSTLRLHVAASQGEIDFDLGAWGAPPRSVRFHGLSGTWNAPGERLELRNLDGQGWIEIQR